VPSGFGNCVNVNNFIAPKKLGYITLQKYQLSEQVPYGWFFFHQLYVQLRFKILYITIRFSWSKSSFESIETENMCEVFLHVFIKIWVHNSITSQWFSSLDCNSFWYFLGFLKKKSSAITINRLLVMLISWQYILSFTSIPGETHFKNILGFTRTLLLCTFQRSWDFLLEVT